jgi:phage tail sheath protein FI
MSAARLEVLEDRRLLSFPLGEGEKHAFSYSAIYHPWLINSEQSITRSFKRNPPDGAICGVFAKRALARGAWIAPANELLRDVIGLASVISPKRWLDLQEMQVNLIRHEPRGFVALSADTLSDDDDLRPVNVRRLLILLRRLALGLGARYVFEPQSESFRRLVQRSFEAMLDRMFERGAFAGATPDTSFQVVTNSSLNTPQSVEQGRFIVELKVAPSLPLTFLTVRLVQTNDRGFVSEGG